MKHDFFNEGADCIIKLELKDRAFVLYCMKQCIQENLE